MNGFPPAGSRDAARRIGLHKGSGAMTKRTTAAFVNAILLVLLAGALAACNTTAPMEVPPVEEKELKSVDKPREDQALFSLAKVIVNLKRGTTIAHLPLGGVDGVQGMNCNARYQGNATMEWNKGTALVGNWQTQLGEVFHEVLTERGFNIAGDPKDMFGRFDTVVAADYQIGARIHEIKGNICHVHHWWDGRPMRQYSGEMRVAVEWTVFSEVLQRRILKLETEGYTKQVEPKAAGINLLLQNAFGEAAKNLTASQKFVDVALRQFVPGETLAVDDRFGTLKIPARRLSKTPIKRQIDRILSAVVTIRAGAAWGSGFAIAENGLIMTNAHVVGDAKKVRVVLNNGLETAGEVLRRHGRRDVALVKVPIRVPTPLPINPAEPAALDKVYVVGTLRLPILRSTMTAGVVSAIRRNFYQGMDIIQADAATTGGNSGGPLLDEKGNVIGLSVAGYNQAQNLNLFIPIQSGLEILKVVRVGR
jgi:serine protease Do